MADKTLRVTCSKCKKRTEIMTPPADHPSPVVWRCNSPLADGITLCGATNTLDI